MQVELTDDEVLTLALALTWYLVMAREKDHYEEVAEKLSQKFLTMRIKPDERDN